MNRKTTILPCALAAAILAVLAWSARCQVLYEDAHTFVGNFNSGNGELGNSVTLPGGFSSYLITSFQFQFDFTGSGSGPVLSLQTPSTNSAVASWPLSSIPYQLYSAASLMPPINWIQITNQAIQSNGTSYVTFQPCSAGQFYRLAGPPTGAEMADLRFYRNDGSPVSPSGAPSPETLLFDSGDFAIGIYGFTLMSIATLEPADLNGGVVVPQSFTWTVTFSGLAADETAGLALYSTTTVGTNYDSAWLKSGTNWQLLMAGVGDPAPTFGAIAYGTPIPVLQFSAQGGLLMLSWPTNAAGFSLQVTTNLANPNWVPVPGVVVTNSQNVVTNAPSGSTAFYRLINETAVTPIPLP
jgi:hypothetical protein